MKKDVYDLSKPQESIWLTEQYFKNTNINRIITIADFSHNTKTLDFNALKQSLNNMIKSNDNFQIRLFLDNGTIKQYFCDFEEIDFPIYEIDSLDDFIDEDCNRQNVFNLLESPLYEFKIFKIKGTNTGGILGSFHHIICDAITTALCIRQIAESYNSLIASGSLPKLNPDNCSYRQYIDNEKEYVQSDKFLKDKEYWDEIYKTVPEVATIYSNQTTNNYLSCEADRLTVSFDEDMTNKINSFCQNLKISVYNFFMAIIGIYISRVSRLDDFVIGTPILNRTNFKEKHTLGMFISTIPFRMTINNDMTFDSFVSTIAKDTLSMLRHQKYNYQHFQFQKCN